MNLKITSVMLLTTIALAGCSGDGTSSAGVDSAKTTLAVKSVSLPELRDMTPKAARELLAQINFEGDLQIDNNGKCRRSNGEGKIYRQSPKAGTALAEVRGIELTSGCFDVHIEATLEPWAQITFHKIHNLKAYDSATITPVWAEALGLPAFFFNKLDAGNAEVSLQADGSVIIKNITQDIDVQVTTTFVPM